jgi:tetratricopeptide (TPR) repeat protein
VQRSSETHPGNDTAPYKRSMACIMPIHPSCLYANKTRYLYETGDYNLSIEIIDIVQSVCTGKTSVFFAELCNTHGAVFYELNRTADCRANWKQSYTLRKHFAAEAAPDDVHAMEDFGFSMHNWGNLEYSAGRYEQVLQHYCGAVDIRLKIGNGADVYLPMAYLGIGSCFAGQKRFDGALQIYGQAQKLFLRTLGPQKYFMSFCHQ